MKRVPLNWVWRVLLSHSAHSQVKSSESVTVGWLLNKKDFFHIGQRGSIMSQTSWPSYQAGKVLPQTSWNAIQTVASKLGKKRETDSYSGLVSIHFFLAERGRIKVTWLQSFKLGQTNISQPLVFDLGQNWMSPFFALSTTDFQGNGFSSFCVILPTESITFLVEALI